MLSVDWPVSMGAAWRRANDALAAQGNLDSVVALADGDEMVARVCKILTGTSGHGGHIFSLGHHVLCEAPPENLRRIVEVVHSETRRNSR